MAFELDPRLARRKFEAAYPDELQESLWLEEVSLSADQPVEVVVRSISLSDHMTGRKTPYISLPGLSDNHCRNCRRSELIYIFVIT